MNEKFSLEGKIYASTFTILSETKDNSNYIIQTPKREVLEKVRGLLNEINSELGPSRDILLRTIRATFYDNAFARNPILMIQSAMDLLGRNKLSSQKSSNH